LVQAAKLSRISPALFDAQSLGLGSLRALLLGWGAAPALLDQAFALDAALSVESHRS
jgi:hypothetical protein